MTAKALTHRFAKLRNTAPPTEDQSAAANTTGSPNTGSSSTKKTTTAGSGRGKKRSATEMNGSADTGDNAEVSTHLASLGENGLISPGVEAGDEGAGGPAVEVAKKPRGRKPKGDAKPKTPRGKKTKSEDVVRDDTTGEIVEEGKDKVKHEEEDGVEKQEELVQMQFEQGI